MIVAVPITLANRYCQPAVTLLRCPVILLFVSYVCLIAALTSVDGTVAHNDIVLYNGFHAHIDTLCPLTVPWINRWDAVLNGWDINVFSYSNHRYLLSNIL